MITPDEVETVLRRVDSGEIGAVPRQCPQIGIGAVSYDLANGWRVDLFIRHNSWRYVEAVERSDGATATVDELGDRILRYTPNPDALWERWRLPTPGLFRCEGCNRKVHAAGNMHTETGRALCWKCTGVKRAVQPVQVTIAKDVARAWFLPARHRVDGGEDAARMRRSGAVAASVAASQAAAQWGVASASQVRRAMLEADAGRPGLAMRISGDAVRSAARVVWLRFLSRSYRRLAYDPDAT